MCKRLLGLVLLAWVAQFSSWAQEAPAESAQPLVGGECYYDLLVKDRDMSVDTMGPSWWEISGRYARGLFEGRYAAMFGSEWNAAAEACRVAFEAGDARSGFWLADYYNRLGRVEEANDYFKKSAAMGEPYSLYLLGRDYLRLYPITIPEHDIETGFDYIYRAADKGYGEAQKEVAFYYDRAKDFAHNLTLAYDYYFKAAENGNPHGMFAMGKLYLYYGSGQCASSPYYDSDPEYQAGVRDYQRKRQEELSFMNIACDIKKGMGYLVQAAKMSYHAASDLAYIYQSEGNIKEAAYWYSYVLQWDISDDLYNDLKDYGSSLFRPTSILSVRQVQKSARKNMEQAGISEIKIMNRKIYRNHVCQYNDYSWYYKCKGDKL